MKYCGYKISGDFFNVKEASKWRLSRRFLYRAILFYENAFDEETTSAPLLCVYAEIGGGIVSFLIFRFGDFPPCVI